jgi:hypothetical protein
LKILVSVVRFRPGPPRIQHRNDANDNATFGWRCRLFARLQFVRRSIPGLLLKQAIGLSLIAQAWLQHHFRIPFPPAFTGAASSLRSTCATFLLLIYA